MPVVVVVVMMVAGPIETFRGREGKVIEIALTAEGRSLHVNVITVVGHHSVLVAVGKLRVSPWLLITGDLNLNGHQSFRLVGSWYLTRVSARIFFLQQRLDGKSPLGT